MLSVLNGEEVLLPETLVENETVFKNVVNFDTWNSFSVEEQKELLEFLPCVDTCNDQFQEDTIRTILGADKNFKFGNPVQDAYEKLKSGLLAASVIKMKKRCKELKYKSYKLKQKEYYKNLLQEIIIARQNILDNAYKQGAGYKLPKMSTKISYSIPLSEKIQRKYNKILHDVSAECGDEGLSSDEEILSSNCDMSKYNLPSKMQGNITCQTSSDLVLDTDFDMMLENHKKKRILCESHPDLETTNISLADVIMRCNYMTKSGKLKGKKNNKKKKLKNQVSEVLRNEDNIDQRSNYGANNQTVLEKKKKDMNKSTCHGYQRFASFFSLLGYFFEQEREKKCTASKVKERLAQWQNHATSELCGWKALYSDWLPLVRYAVDYMSGKGSASLLHDFIPLLLPVGINEWVWTGPEHNNNTIILPLCNHWLETLSEAMNTDTSGDKDRKTIDTTRTSYIVHTSTEEEKAAFCEQEKERYANPHKPFIYTTHGYQSIVGPVKGVFSSKDITTSKAREHAMLVSIRPAYVTILCLVRDAVARLPNGEGTRADVCTLLKDSQFLNPKANDTQVHGVVSGALDRLHAEKDPCVKFDAVRKLWIYLHRTRSLEEFEKLHEASAAAALAKKQLSQSKQKASKQKKAVSELIEMQSDKGNKIKKDGKRNNSTKREHADKHVEKADSTGNVLQTGDEQKKKSAKRKRNSVNEVPNPKVIKTHEIEPEKPELFEDLQMSLENEALMAAQSILSDDDTDIFGESRHHSEILDLETFNTTSDELPSLSMESPVNTSFSMDHIGSYGSVTEGSFNDVSFDEDRVPFQRLEEAHRRRTSFRSSSSLDLQSSTATYAGKADSENSSALNFFVQSESAERSVAEEISNPEFQRQISLSQLSDIYSSANPSLTSVNRGYPSNQSSGLQSHQQMFQKEKVQQMSSGIAKQQQQQLVFQQQLAQVDPQPKQYIKIDQQTTLASKHTSNFPHGRTLISKQRLPLPVQVIQTGQRLPQQPIQAHMSQSIQLQTVQGTPQMQTVQRRPQLAPQQQPVCKAKPSPNQASLSFGTMAGTSLQNLSQFLISKTSPRPDLSSVPTVCAASSVVTTIATIQPVNMNTSLNAVLGPRNPYQIQQSNRSTVPPADAINRNARMQSNLVPSGGNIGQLKLRTNTTGAISGYQLIDVKGSRGNQMITAQPPSSMYVQKSVPGYIKASPIQTFSLNQLMAVARTPDGSMSKPHNSNVPMQSVRSGNSQSTAPVTSIQALLQVMQKPVSPNNMSANNTQLLIQHQPTSTDQNVGKIITLPKTVLKGSSFVQTPFQKLENLSRFSSQGISANQTIGNLTFQQTSRPAVAPLKISLPRTNFPGVPSPVRISSPGIRIHSPVACLPLPMVNSLMLPKTQSPKTEEKQE